MYSLELLPGGFEWIIAKASASFDIFKYQICFSLPSLISIALKKNRKQKGYFTMTPLSYAQYFVGFENCSIVRAVLSFLVHS